MKQLRKMVMNSLGDARQEAVRTLRNQRRIRKKEMNPKKLQRVSLSSKRSCVYPMALEVGGVCTVDREAWLTEALAFGTQRFTDPTSPASEQKERLERLEGLRQGCQLDGQGAPKMKLFDVMHGRAKMKSGTSGGDDLLVPEVLKALPFIVVIRIWQLFRDRQQQRHSVDPLSRRSKNTARADPFLKLLEF